MRLDAADVLAVLRDPDCGLQLAALEGVVALAGEDPGARRVLASAIAAEPPILELASGLGRAGAVALLRALGEAPAGVLASTLRAVRAGHVTLTWEDVPFALTRVEPAVANEVLLAIPTCPSAAALPWLARVFLDSEAEPSECRRSGWSYLKALIAEDTVGLIPAVHRTTLCRELEKLRAAAVSALEIPEDEDGPDDYEREFYEAELGAIARIEGLLIGAD